MFTANTTTQIDDHATDPVKVDISDSEVPVRKPFFVVVMLVLLKMSYLYSSLVWTVMFSICGSATLSRKHV